MKMESEKRKVKTNKGLKDYTYLGCPLTRNRTAWCYRMCMTDKNGFGQCGRIAPHSFKSAIQIGIEKYNKKQFDEHFKKLENFYLSNPLNSALNPGIRIAGNEVEIIVNITRNICNLDGTIYSSICSKLLQDSAALMANTKTNLDLILVDQFNLYLSNRVAYDQLITRARFISQSGKQFLAESVIVDSNRTEIARGSGVFVKSDIPLNSYPEYK